MILTNAVDSAYYSLPWNGKFRIQCLCSPDINCSLDGISPANRPNLIITTYGLIQSSVDDFTHENFDWDYVVLDEAHKIKNPGTDVAKNIRLVARGDETHRLILTGTPIMNNLRELWALFDFVTSGKVLGSAIR